MAGRTGYDVVGNGSPMQGPAQITAVAQHFDSLIGETVPTVNDLPPADPAFIGRIIFVQSDKSLRRSDGTAWRIIHIPDIHCRLTKTSAQQTGGAAFGFVSLSFDIEDYDPSNMHTSAQLTRITVPVAGYYSVKAQYTGNTASIGYGVKLAVNGNPIEGTQVWDAGLGANGLASPHVADILRLNANDYVEAQAACVSASQNVATSAGFRASFAVGLIQAT